MQYSTCRHLKEDGIYCGSPALADRSYCYYHLTLRGRRLRRAQALRRGMSCPVQIPPLDSLRGIHIALTEVLDALAHGQIEARAAGQMLYAIQQTTSVLRAINEEAEWQDDDLDDTDDSRIREFPNFEAQYGLPFGIDLEAPPEVALQQAEALPSTPAAPPTAPPAPPVERAVSRKPAAGEKREVSFQDLQQQLRIVQEAARRRDAEAKKPPASAAPVASEVADTA